MWTHTKTIKCDKHKKVKHFLKMRCIFTKIRKNDYLISSYQSALAIYVFKYVEHKKTITCDEQ